MKAMGLLLTIVVSVVLQVTLARYTVGGRWVFDFVLVGVVFAGLQWGPVAGLFGGTIGGLLQDVLSGQIVGVGGLAKTIVGFAAGVIGTQFVLTRPQARTRTQQVPPSLAPPELRSQRAPCLQRASSLARATARHERRSYPQPLP